MNENKMSQIECPICRKKMQNEFSLKGHLRLMKDADHTAFRQAHNTKEENKILPTSPPTPFTATKLIDRLMPFVEEQEKLYKTETEQNEFLAKLKNMIAQERENDATKSTEDYQRGCNDTIQQYEDDIRTYLHQKEEEIRAALTQEFTAKKEYELNDMKKKYEEQIENIRRETQTEINKNYLYTLSTYAIYIPCPWCHSDCLVGKNSQLYFEIVTLMGQAELGHPECVQRYAPRNAYY